MVYYHWGYRLSEATFVRAPVRWLGKEVPVAGIMRGREAAAATAAPIYMMLVQTFPSVAEKNKKNERFTMKRIFQARRRR